MGQRAQGYRVRQRTKGGIFKVRFRVDGRRYDLSTGTRDRGEAEQEARRLYAEALGARGTPERRRPSGFDLTTRHASKWVASLALRPDTVENYEEFAVRWIRRIKTWDDAGLAAYVRERLREAIAKTVRSEVSALRGCLRWLVEVGELSEMPLLPAVPKSALGTPAKRRTRVAAPELSKREVNAFLKKLPDRAVKGWWVRPRCEFLYLSSLRPATVDALSVPEHWMPGSSSLNITTDIDKEGFAREQPLSPRALAILKRCAPERGVIFGEHKYYRYVRKAAAGTLAPAKAKVFTGQHLRSARATHLLDAGATITGAQYLLGHRRSSTTARYVRPSKKEAAKALRRAG